MGDFSAYPEALADLDNLPLRTAHSDLVTAADHNAQSGFIRDITKTLGINPHGEAVDVAARLSAIDILLASPSAPAHTVIVAKSGGHFSTIQAAINSITDNNPGNEYLILVYPGLYTENLTLKQNIHISAYLPEMTALDGSVTLSAQGDGIIYFNLFVATSQSPALNLNGGDTAFYLLSRLESWSGIAINLTNQTFYAKDAIIRGWTRSIASTGSYIHLRNCILSTGQYDASAYIVTVNGGDLKAGYCIFHSAGGNYAIYSPIQQNVYLMHCVSNRVLSGVVNLVNSSNYGFSLNTNIKPLDF